MDLSKVFDGVCQSQIILALSQLRIKNLVLNWLQSYLKTRLIVNS